VQGRLIILSAPSGSGKTTIINHILHSGLPVSFSVSATSRPPRGTEQNGCEYWFLSPDEFKQKIRNNEFLEYEEVYEDRFYGTLRSEVENRLNRGENIILDVDVAGGLNIKKLFGDKSLLIFIKPPSVDELRRRLEHRGTDTAEVINDRIAKAEYELSLADRYDRVIVNDDLEKAKNDAENIISEFIAEKD